MKRCLLILLLVLSATMLPGGRLSGQDVVSSQDTIQQLSRLQKMKSRVQQRIDDKINEPYDTTRNSGYWWRALICCVYARPSA